MKKLRKRPYIRLKLKLRAKDRSALEKLLHKGELSVRVFRRARALLLLNEGHPCSFVGKAVGLDQDSVNRLGKRYLRGGLPKALAINDQPVPKTPRTLDKRQEELIVAMVCGPPPEGAKWVCRVIAEEAVARGIVAKVGRETIRLLLSAHGLKPWREKNVVRRKNR